MTKRTTIASERPDTPDAEELIAELEASLAPLYPRESRHGLSVQQLIDQDVQFFVVRHDGKLVGCGGVKFCGTEYGELKRMYIRPQFRGLGLGKKLLERLASFSVDHGVNRLKLETGIHQREAIGLYEGWGFKRIGPFGGYKEDPLSLFFELDLPTRNSPWHPNESWA